MKQFHSMTTHLSPNITDILGGQSVSLMEDILTLEVLCYEMSENK